MATRSVVTHAGRHLPHQGDHVTVGRRRRRAERQADQDRRDRCEELGEEHDAEDAPPVAAHELAAARQRVEAALVLDHHALRHE